MSSLSFKEKSLWGTLAALVAVSLLYFWSVVDMAAAGVTDLRALGGLGIGLAVVFILVEIVYHSMIAGSSPKEAEAGEDERDRSSSSREAGSGESCWVSASSSPSATSG